VEWVKSNHLVEIVGRGGQPTQTGQCRDEGVDAALRLEVDASRALFVDQPQRVGLGLVLERVDDDAGHPLAPLDRARMFCEHVTVGARVATVARLQAQHRPLLRAVTRVKQDSEERHAHAADVLVQLHALVARLDGVAERQIQRPLQHTPAAAFGLLLCSLLLAVVHVRYVRNRMPLHHPHDVVDHANSHRVQVVGCQSGMNTDNKKVPNREQESSVSAVSMGPRSLARRVRAPVKARGQGAHTGIERKENQANTYRLGTTEKYEHQKRTTRPRKQRRVAVDVDAEHETNSWGDAVDSVLVGFEGFAIDGMFTPVPHLRGVAA